MFYGLIPLCSNDTVNPVIPIKPWLCARFFYYDEIHIYVTTSQSGGEGQGNRWVDYGTERHMDQIGQLSRSFRIDNILVLNSGHIFLSLFLSIVVSFSIVSSLFTKPIMLAVIVIILLFMPLLTRSRNGSN